MEEDDDDDDYVNYMFRTILFVAIIRLGTIIGENNTIYKTIRYHVIYCGVFSDNCIQPDDGQN